MNRGGKGAVVPEGVLRGDLSAPEAVAILLQLRDRLARLEGSVCEQQRVREFYSTAEVTEILGRAEFTVREWCRIGRLGAEKKRSGRGKHPSWVIADAELRRTQREERLGRNSRKGRAGRGRCCPVLMRAAAAPP